MSSEIQMFAPFSKASLMVRSLYKMGVRHAVISPGSRSTALTMAFAFHDGFKKHVVLDERSAAFIALGIGKKTGVPAVLICTSGTAPAHYYPAVIEARESGVPMIILSADRPPTLQGIGSSQTINQTRLFANHSVSFYDTGESFDSEKDRQRLSYAVRQAVIDSIRHGGASHINIPFRKPFEPDESQIKAEKECNQHQVSADNTHHVTYSKTVTLSPQLQEKINKAKKPLIIAGPANQHHSLKDKAGNLAGKLSAPVLAEPGSGFTNHENKINRFDQFLRSDKIADDLQPDLILRFGDQPFTKSLLDVLERWRDVELIHFTSRPSWQDHTMSIDHTIQLSPGDTLVSENFDSKDKNWLNQWIGQDENSDQFLQEQLSEVSKLTDGHIFHHLSHQLSAHWNLMLSNSLPVRDLALFGQSKGNESVNRGAAGIDGILSTSIGLSLATDRPTCCVIGDLAFLHDSNALLSLSHVNAPFLIVVINNGGGNIFRMLPVYQQKQVYTSYFETPQNASISDLVRAHDLQYQKIQSVDELHEFSVSEEMKSPAVIECVTDSDKSMELRHQLWQ